MTDWSAGCLCVTYGQLKKFINSILFLPTVSTNVIKTVKKGEKNQQKSDQAKKPMSYKQRWGSTPSASFSDFCKDSRQFLESGGGGGRKSALLMSTKYQVTRKTKTQMFLKCNLQLLMGCALPGSKSNCQPVSCFPSLLLLCTRDTVGTVAD